jgi:putative endonuclease
MKQVTTVQVGNRAEQAAAEYLVRAGFEIVCRNYRRPHCEIDIVARRAAAIFFVEVKYRRDDHFGGGFAAIAHDKLRHMARAANTWVRENRWNGEFMLAAVEVSGDYQVSELIEIV